MNYLAHAYLSFQQPGVLVGNLISDFVKGRQQFQFDKAIQKGIQLHRAIDTFTDTHPLVKSTKAYFKPAVGAYAGAFLDVAFDHFIATDTTIFPSDQHLLDFSQDTYRLLQLQAEQIPENCQPMFNSMQKHNWLYHYQHYWGIENSFKSLTKRAAYLDADHQCFSLFTEHYFDIKTAYQSFFPALVAFVQAELNISS